MVCTALILSAFSNFSAFLLMFSLVRFNSYFWLLLVHCCTRGHARCAYLQIARRTLRAHLWLKWTHYLSDAVVRKTCVTSHALNRLNVMYLIFERGFTHSTKTKPTPWQPRLHHCHNNTLSCETVEGCVAYGVKLDHTQMYILSIMKNCWHFIWLLWTDTGCERTLL